MSSWNSALLWLEGSALGEAIRGAGVWAYGVVNLTHIVGIATLFGSIVVLDLCLLGWRRGALDAIASLTAPLAATGFVIAALSGICMLATNGSEYIGNPFVPIKFVAIGLGLLNAVALGRLTAWKTCAAHNSRDRLLLPLGGGMSLLCWIAALSAGRMIGYW